MRQSFKDLHARMRSGFSAGERSDLFDLASAVVFAAAIWMVFATYQDYGVNVDERYHVTYGDAMYRYFRSGFADWSNPLESAYGGGFDLAGAAVRAWLPLHKYTAMHLFGGLVGLLGFVGAWKLGRILWGPQGGFWSLVLLALTPPYYAQMFDNPKDLPFAVAYLWSVYCLTAIVESLPRVSWTLWLRFGIAVGLSLSVRVGGLLLFFYLALCLGLYVAGRAVGARSAETAWQLVRRFAPGALAAFATAWSIMLALWPWAAQAPLARPLEALGLMTHYDHYRPPSFLGGGTGAYHTPWDYLPRRFLFQLPEAVLILFVVGAIGGAWLCFARVRARRRLRRSIVFTLLALAIVFPPLYAILQRSTLYSGLRHFLFVVPPLCVVAAGTLVALQERLRSRRALRFGLPAAVACFCAIQLCVNCRLHPHYYAYYNQLTGGLPGALGKYETFSEAGYREAFLMLDEHLWRTEPDRYLAGYTVGGCFRPFIIDHALPPTFRYARRPDFWLGYTRRNCHKRHGDQPEVLRVSRFGVPLVVVRDLRRPP